ncbi:hypothetical protein D3C78_1211810 [compost metagenome]
MSSRCPASVPIVRHNRVDRYSRNLTAYDHNRHKRNELFQYIGILYARSQHDAIHPLLHEQRNIPLNSLILVVCVAHNHAVAMLMASVLHCSRYLRKEWIRNIRDK